MFLPITSTSELRYWPFATGALIVLNIVAFIIQHTLPDSGPSIDVNRLYQLIGDADPADRQELLELLAVLNQREPGWVPYALAHGNGLHPVQWLTSMFMHADAAHLIGNLVFLWVFGHIVEGVVGHGMFTLLYVGLGVLGNFIEQLLFMGASDGRSLGASGAIYSIMLLAAWFCPQDHVQGFIIVFYRFILVNVPVLMMAGFYFIWDVALAIFIRFQMSTPLLHAMGGALGLVAGFLLLRLGYVENDGQDALTMIRSMGGKDPEPIVTRRQSKFQAERQQQLAQARGESLETAQRSLAMHWEAENVDGVLHQVRQIRRHDARFKLDERTHYHLIAMAQSQQRWHDVVQLSEQYLSVYAERAISVRLNLARVFVMQQGMPTRALKTLKALEGVVMDPKQTAIAHRLRQAALKALEDGELELRD